MKSNVPDQFIINVLEKVEMGEINPDEKRYIFKMASGVFIGFIGSNELEAREKAEAKGHDVVDLVNVEYDQYAGLTLQEIKAEAKKRNLGESDYE